VKPWSVVSSVTHLHAEFGAGNFAPPRTAAQSVRSHPVDISCQLDGGRRAPNFAQGFRWRTELTLVSLTAWLPSKASSTDPYFQPLIPVHPRISRIAGNDSI